MNKCLSGGHVCLHHVLFLFFSGNVHGSSSSAVRFFFSSSGPTSGWRLIMTTMSSTGEFSLMFGGTCCFSTDISWSLTLNPAVCPHHEAESKPCLHISLLEMFYEFSSLIARFTLSSIRKHGFLNSFLN